MSNYNYADEALNREMAAFHKNADGPVNHLKDYYGELFAESRAAAGNRFDRSQKTAFVEGLNGVERALGPILDDPNVSDITKFYQTADTVKSAIQPTINEPDKVAPVVGVANQAMNHEVFQHKGKDSRVKYIVIAVIALVVILIIVVGSLYGAGIIGHRTVAGTVPTAPGTPSTPTPTPPVPGPKSMTAFPTWQGLDPGPYVPVPRVDVTSGGLPANPPGNWFSTGMMGPRAESYITPYKSVEFPQQNLFYRYAYNG